MPNGSDSRVVALVLPGGPDPWRAAGFSCSATGFSAGPIELLTGLPARAQAKLVTEPLSELDGAGSTTRPVAEAHDGGPHPNGVTGVDHVVIATPAIGRARDALVGAGLDLRLERDGRAGVRDVTQAFFLAGSCVVELVGGDAGAEGPSSLWGVTFATPDLDALPALDPPPVASIRDAVQPGRRIAVARRELGLPIRVAFMNPRQSAGTR